MFVTIVILLGVCHRGGYEHMNAKKLFLMVMVVLCTMVCAFSQQYKIGDEGPGGGIVFYYSEKGFDVYEADGSVTRCNYLEVSKTEVACVAWCPCTAETGFCFIGSVSEIGFGKTNTYKIINGKHGGGAVSSSNCAAKVCFEYSTVKTAKGEWFLPSKDELNLLYKNLGKRILATATGDFHWSSYQYSDNCAWNHSFGIDYQGGDYKGCTRSVRAIRAF